MHLFQQNFPNNPEGNVYFTTWCRGIPTGRHLTVLPASFSVSGVTPGLPLVVRITTVVVIEFSGRRQEIPLVYTYIFKPLTSILTSYGQFHTLDNNINSSKTSRTHPVP